MSLMKSSQIPKDAVVLSENEATTYIWELVNDWESLSDTYVNSKQINEINTISHKNISCSVIQRWRNKAIGVEVLLKILLSFFIFSTSM